MRAYSSMPSESFISLIREAAINGKAAPLVIDQIDSLYELAGKDDEIEKLGEETTKAEQARDEMEGQRDALADILREMLDSVPVLDGAKEDPMFNKLTTKAEAALTEICK